METEIIEDKKVLSAKRDPMGTAILDYFNNGRAWKLRVLSSMFDEDEFPVDHLFREQDEMPLIERKAIEMSHGRILDVGAGAGCHALALQDDGKDVTAIDISPLSCQVMRESGVKKVKCINLFDPDLEGGFDTVLLLMNGAGIAGKAANLAPFLERVARLLNEDGQILIDSSDLKYVYENEDGTYDFDTTADYYGEVDYVMQYKGIRGEPFDWLYADFELLKESASAVSLKCEMVLEGEHYDYLARLTKVADCY